MATATASTAPGTFTPGPAGASALATSISANPRGAMATVGAGAGAAAAFADAGTVADYSGPFGPIKQVLDQPAVKKSLPMMVIAVALLAFALVYTMVNQPSYRPVMSGITEADQQAVFEALKAADFTALSPAIAAALLRP